MKSIVALLLLSVCLTAISGCGGGEPTVIMPGEDYQLTPEEQANKDAEDEMRKGG